ncbi:MAG: hypothetical protein HY773_00475 [Candidatus Terrybacteria bacterium]|nr:hypothetical protein [Candidatus Terrybacteria bacterium]
MPSEEKIKKEEDKIPALRTYKTDTSEYVKKRGVSLIEIAAEEARGRGIKIEEENRFSLKKIIIISASSVIIIGISFAGIWFFTKGQKEGQPTSFLKPILISEDQVEIYVYPENYPRVLNEIKKAIQSQTRINQLLYVSLVRQVGESKVAVGSREFFRITGASPPQELLDSLENEFMLSKFYFTKDCPILIFKVAAFDSAFAGMMKWETAMADDFKDVFSLELSNARSFFEDREIQNRDIRVLNDKDSQPLLLYSFMGRDYLIITTDEEPLKEIFRRFSSFQYLND